MGQSYPTAAQKMAIYSRGRSADNGHCKTAGIPPGHILIDAFQQVMARAASGELRIDTERVPLANIEDAWQRRDLHGRRLVITPQPA